MNILRIKKLQGDLEHPILIKKKENLLYLTGRSFMRGYLLVSPRKSAVFFGDGLEHPPAGKGIKSDRLKNLALYLTKAHRLQLEDEFTFAEFKYIKSKLYHPLIPSYIRRRVPRSGGVVKIQHLKSPVDYQRQIKDEIELGHIRTSMRIVGRVFEQVKKQLKRKSWTEVGLAEFIKQAGHRLGAEDVSFPPIVASGANAAVPHHVPSSKKLKIGESIIIDFGFKYKNYCSDFTRTIFIKTVPKRLEIAYNQVEKAYNESINFINQNITPQPPLKLRGGIGSSSPYNKGRLGGDINAGDVYQTAIDVLAEKKLDKYFIHSLGHGSGLEIHELPNLSPKSKDRLENGMVFSIEPGVYIPKSGGIRLEDLVYLKQGKVQRFINQPTSLKESIL
jgi:Xaa-Pro aminopeptidase